jgi:hypothetical protein
MPERSLLPLAKSRFADIEGSPAELALIRKVVTSEPARFDTTGLYTSAADNADEGPHKWGPERDIRAELIRWLATDPEASQFLDVAGIQITGARIVGFLDLQAAIVKVPISFTGCRLGGVSISNGRLYAFTLYLCWCRGLSANVTTVDSTLNLRGSTFEDLVTVSNAQVGSLLCGGTYCAKFFTAYRIRVAGSVELNASRVAQLNPDPFTVRAQYHLKGLPSAETWT